MTSRNESTVLMMAAMIAASMNPATQGLNSRLDKAMKMCSGSATETNPFSDAANPTNPVRMAPYRVRTTQIMASIVDLANIWGLLIAMNRTRMWGWPK